MTMARAQVFVHVGVRVYAVGPEQNDVRVGEWVCVAHGRWTRGIEIEDENGKQTLRRVDPKDILMESDEEPKDVTFSQAIHVEAKPHMQHNYDNRLERRKVI
jgi:hypothetical protein